MNQAIEKVRKPTSVSLDRLLVDEAKELGVNVSRAAEEGLVAALKAERTRRWKAENAEAMREYNEFVDREGILLSEHRMFP